MSRENVEVVRRVFGEWWAGLERGDPGAVFDTEAEAVADDFEWIVPEPGFEGRSVWRGRQGFVEFVRTWTEEFEDWSIRLERFIELAMNELSYSRTSRQPEKRAGAGRVEERPGLGAEKWTRRSGEELPQSRRGPRSRRAVGIGRGSYRSADCLSREPMP
jgi:SnoaL-like domain